jgi:Phosphatidylserine/phosphatidylglycerophosphate/cardiolipin synthases and related enzymes
MHQLFIFILCLIFTTPTLHAEPSFADPVRKEEQVCFQTSADRKQLGTSITNGILQAKESVLIFTFSLSDPNIIRALNQKVAEGLKVTLVIDKDHLGQIRLQGDPRIEVVTRINGEGHIHHKILVVDREEIWIGSANFTTAGYGEQENLMTSFYSKELGDYLHHEASVFRKTAFRKVEDPLIIELTHQNVTFMLLPHEGFPPMQTERMINQRSKQHLLHQIEKAERSLKIAMMVWTSNDLARAVLDAHQRGVHVEVIAPDFEGNLLQLKQAGIDVRVNPLLKFMHNKFLWVDNTCLVNGSANWSQSAFTRNDESFIVIEPLLNNQLDFLEEYWKYLFGSSF